MNSLLTEINARFVRKGHVILASGLISDVYVDIKGVALDRDLGPALGIIVAEHIATVVPSIRSVTLAGVPYGGVLVAMRAAPELGASIIIPRDGVLEGPKFSASVVLVEDVMTSGTSAKVAVNRLAAWGIEVTKTVTVVARSKEVARQCPALWLLEGGRLVPAR